MTRVKICGLTRPQDVRLATTLGAWACGFVLTPSPRQITPHRASQLARQAVEAAGRGEALTVAVVTTEAPEEIADLLAISGLAAVQLSAGPDGPSVTEVRAAAERRGLWPRVIAAADTADAADADWLLLDARCPGRYGGTGETADWTAASRLARDGRLLLAGGLQPGNVAAALAAVRPFALDVSSGVERRPGIKDRALMSAFFAAANGGDGERGPAG